jgi:hypothetical protein|tara:strand:+ start:924 stop:1298 length:375 start_codon:yes stop_codon:yes gene_type:complete
MLIHIDNFDISKLNPNIFNMMKHLICYLDNEWKIKKSNNGYILSKNKNKIYTLDITNNIIEDNVKPNNIYVLAFLYNVLNNGWTIKKNKKEYIFIKNHEGKKEIFSDNYINTFLKDNFNFNLIK